MIGVYLVGTGPFKQHFFNTVCQCCLNINFCSYLWTLFYINTHFHPLWLPYPPKKRVHKYEQKIMFIQCQSSTFRQCLNNNMCPQGRSIDVFIHLYDIQKACIHKMLRYVVPEYNDISIDISIEVIHHTDNELQDVMQKRLIRLYFNPVNC